MENSRRAEQVLRRVMKAFAVAKPCIAKAVAAGCYHGQEAFSGIGVRWRTVSDAPGGFLLWTADVEGAVNYAEFVEVDAVRHGMCRTLHAGLALREDFSLVREFHGSRNWAVHRGAAIIQGPVLPIDALVNAGCSAADMAALLHWRAVLDELWDEGRSDNVAEAEVARTESVEATAQQLHAALQSAAPEAIAQALAGEDGGTVQITGIPISWEVTDRDGEDLELWLECCAARHADAELALFAGVESFGQELLICLDDAENPEELVEYGTWTLSSVRLAGGIGVARDEYLASATVTFADGTSVEIEGGKRAEAEAAGVSPETLKLIEAWWHAL